MEVSLDVGAYPRIRRYGRHHRQLSLKVNPFVPEVSSLRPREPPFPQSSHHRNPPPQVLSRIASARGYQTMGHHRSLSLRASAEHHLSLRLRARQCLAEQLVHLRNPSGFETRRKQDPRRCSSDGFSSPFLDDVAALMRDVLRRRFSPVVSIVLPCSGRSGDRTR